MRLRTIGSMILVFVLVITTFPTQKSALTNTWMLQPSLASASMKHNADISLEEVAERIHALFPDRFETFDHEQLSIHPRHGEDQFAPDTFYASLRQKVDENDQQITAHFEFTNELQLVSFDYQIIGDDQSYYLPTVTRDEAEQIADQFITDMYPDRVYELRQSSPLAKVHTNRTLMEPVRYAFYFQRLVDDIPVEDRYVRISVMGDGEIGSFYGESPRLLEDTFEVAEDTLRPREIRRLVEDHLQLQLRYFTTYDPLHQEQEVHLTFVPSPMIEAVDALGDEWLLDGEWVEDLPRIRGEVQPLRDNFAQSDGKSVTQQDILRQAEQLLAEVSADQEANINGTYEKTNHIGIPIIFFDYVYDADDNGHVHGDIIEFNQESGDLLYVNLRHMHEMDNEKQVDPVLGEDEALDRAINMMETYAPERMDRYAYPLIRERDENVYRFEFPRIENNVPFIDQAIQMEIGTQNGELVYFSAEDQKLDNIPAVEDAYEVEQVKHQFLRKLQVDLVYMEDESRLPPVSERFLKLLTNNFNAELIPNFRKAYDIRIMPEEDAYFDALQGTWEGSDDSMSDKEDITVEHAWAEDELNFMIDMGIIQVDDVDTFDPDRPLNKGTALEVLMRSIVHFWDDEEYYGGQTEETTYWNMNDRHPLSDVIKRAVEEGILDTEQYAFQTGQTLTRQELALWFVRALELEDVVEHFDNRHVEYEDSHQIDEKYEGAVAVVTAFGIMEGVPGGLFVPQDSVTMAQLAVATLRLADTLNSTSGR